MGARIREGARKREGARIREGAGKKSQKLIIGGGGRLLGTLE